MNSFTSFGYNVLNLTLVYLLAISDSETHSGMWKDSIEVIETLSLLNKRATAESNLSSTVIEHLSDLCSSTAGAAVVYFYFHFKESTKQNASHFVSSLNAQLCYQVPELPESLEALYHKCNNGSRKPALHDLKVILADFSTSIYLDDIFIVADALDECPQNADKSRQEVLELIAEIIKWSPSNLHLMVSSRPEIDITVALEALLIIPAVPLQGIKLDQDIECYITSQLETNSKLKKWPLDIKEEIRSTLIKGANEM